jgi:hypothetical protein
MSDTSYTRPRTAGGSGPLKLPRAASMGTMLVTYNNAAQMIERADQDNLKRGTEPTFPSMLLTADDGSTWRVRLAVSGGSASFVIEAVMPR